MKCVICRNIFPDELNLVKPLQFLGRWQMACPICAADYGAVKGLNYRRAERYLKTEKQLMLSAVMKHVSLEGPLTDDTQHT